MSLHLGHSVTKFSQSRRQSKRSSEKPIFSKFALSTVVVLTMTLSACTTLSGHTNDKNTDSKNTNSKIIDPHININTNTEINTAVEQKSKTPIYSADMTAPEQGSGLTKQQLVQADDFMVASANPLATQAGYNILKQGGSAIDAMVAIQTTLGLVEPQSSGLGGGAYVVYWDNINKRLTSFDAREIAPQSATPQLFLEESGKPLEFMQAVIGGRSVGVPGVPKMMDVLHQRYGKLAWSDLFKEPINLAENGFKVSPRMADSIATHAESLSRYPETKAYFLPHGKPLQAGTTLKNPEYAKTVKALAKQGSLPFYHGSLANNIIKRVRMAHDNPGDLQPVDFKSYDIIEREPVCSKYRQFDVCGMGGSSSGGIAVGQIVGVLNQFTTEYLLDNPATTLRVIGDASRLAFADRGKYVGDPDYVTVPTAELLSQDYLKKRADLIKSTHVSLDDVLPGVIELKDNTVNEQVSRYVTAEAIELPSTSHIVVVDREGNVLSMTSSIENAFGSTLMTNGYLLNNELTDFSFKPEKDGEIVANRVEGGKRPRSSMAPTIVMQQGKPYLAVGSPGGSRIIGYVAKTLMTHIDGGLNIQQAIATPHMLNRFGTYEIEENTAAVNVAPILEKVGYKTQIRDLNSGIQGIVITEKGLQGAADPRREGKVMGD